MVLGALARALVPVTWRGLRLILGDTMDTKQTRTAMSRRIMATAHKRIVPTREQIAERHAILIALAAWCDRCGQEDGPISQVDFDEGCADVRVAIAALAFFDRLDLLRSGLMPVAWFN